MIDETQICQEWLDLKKGNIKPTTYDKYEKIITKYLIPLFDECPIDQLNVSKVSDYLNQLLEKGLSRYTVNLIKLILISIYDYAHDQYGYKKIDFDGNLPNTHLKAKPKASDVLNDEQEDILYQYCMFHVDSLSVSILLTLYAGLRCMETCALKIKDVNLEEGFIDINKQVERIVNRENNYSKTLSQLTYLSWPEKRQVVLRPFMINYLNTYIDCNNPEVYLLNKLNSLPAKRTYQNKLTMLSKTLGFDISYSILRNTCKSKCIENDVNIKVIMNMLGLSKLEINIDDTYHEGMDYTREEMCKIDPGI